MLHQAVIKDQPNPDWASAITVDYMFEITQDVSCFIILFSWRSHLLHALSRFSPYFYLHL